MRGKVRSTAEHDDYFRDRFQRKPLFSRRTLVILLVVIVAAAIFHVHGIDEGAGGSVLWNQREADLFVTIDRRGNDAMYLEIPWILFRGLVRAPIPPDDIRRVLVVIRVTGSGVERHVVGLADIIHDSPGGDPSGFTPIGDHIYADCPLLGGVCRWTGDHFEQATEQERSVVSPEILVPNSPYGTDDFDNRADGWSRRVFLAGSRDQKFTVQVADQFRLLITNKATVAKNGTLSIDLERPTKAVQRIAVFDTYAGWLSPWAYLRAFKADI